VVDSDLLDDSLDTVSSILVPCIYVEEKLLYAHSLEIHMNMKILTIRDYTRLNSDLTDILNLLMLLQELHPVVVVVVAVVIILLRFLSHFILIAAAAPKILELNPKALPAPHRLNQCGDVRQVDY
jgi:hypothetical protein